MHIINIYICNYVVDLREIEPNLNIIEKLDIIVIYLQLVNASLHPLQHRIPDSSLPDY